MTTATAGLRRLPLVVDDDAHGVVIDLRDRPGRIDLDLVALEAGADASAPDGADPAAGSEPGERRLPSEEPAPSSVRATRLRPTRVVPVVAAVLVAALALALAGGGDGGPGPGEAEVRVRGRAQLIRADGRTQVVTDHARLAPGDRLDIERGAAVFTLAREVRLEGAAGTSVVMGRTPTLRQGELLVDAPATTTIGAGTTSVAVAAGGAARLARTYAVRVGTYRGSAELRSAGIDRTVPALRAAEVAALGEVGELRPLGYSADDGWDRRYLPEALALDRQLGPLAASMRAIALDPPALLRLVRTEVADAPTLARLHALLADRPVRLDTSIAVAVAGNGLRGSFAERWRAGLAFRYEGATWGLVAQDLGAEPELVLASLRRALDQGPAVLAGSVDADGPPSTLGAGPDDLPADAAVVAADGTAGTGAEIDGGSVGASSAGGSGSTGGAPTGPGGSAPPVGVPPVSVPPVTVPTTVPPVTVPPVLPGVTDPLTEALEPVVGAVGGILAPVVGPVVGTLQPGGLLPILPGPGGGLLGG